MKKLITFLTLLMVLNLQAMEKQNTNSCLASPDILENDYSNIIQYANQFALELNKSVRRCTFTENFPRLIRAFNHCVNKRKSSLASIVLSITLKRYSVILSESETKYLTFVNLFIKSIIQEIKICIKNPYISEKKFQKLYNEYLGSINRLNKYIQKNEIDINNINQQSCAGFDTNLIMLAIKLAPSEKIFHYLMKKKINFNNGYIDETGNTLLHLIASLPFTQATKRMAKCLLQNGIDKAIKNKSNQEAVDIAKANNNTEIVRTLSDKRYSSKKCNTKFSLSKRAAPSNSDNLRRFALYNQAKRYPISV